MPAVANAVDEAFARIHDPNGEGSRAFIRLFESQARATAEAWQRMREAGLPLPPLAGVPVSVKDLFDVEGTTTTAGSFVLKDAPPALRDAPVVARLRAAGAAIVGTTNMTEFAMGGLGINAHYGTPRNPFDRAAGRIPGGSSSGAAVSVCDGMAGLAIGSDTAGSVRMPAALCGIAGFKPTARRVPLAGSIPLAASLDSVGPLGPTVASCILADGVLAGEDSYSLEALPLKNQRLAVAKTLVLDDLDPAVARDFERALTTLSKAGAHVVEIGFAELGRMPELNAQGGFSVIEGFAWHRELLETKGDLYEPIIASRFRNGAKVSAADYIELRNVRAALIEETRKLTSGFDAVLMPTVPIVAPKIADLEADEARYLATNRLMIRNPGIANFLDRCALSIPCHLPGSAPVGLTLMGETMSDRRLLALGLAVEAALSTART